MVINFFKKLKSFVLKHIFLVLNDFEWTKASNQYKVLYMYEYYNFSLGHFFIRGTLKIEKLV